jgi:putative phosphoribosyl transferase
MLTKQLYRDRVHAGQVLAAALKRQRELADPLVLGLPRGGVPLAACVARALGAPLDVLVVRKLGVPGHEEVAMGALASGGIRIMNAEVVDALGISEAALQRVEAAETLELERRERALRGGRRAPRVEGRAVVLVDDGAATGATMLAAIAAVRAQRAREIVVAVPVAPADTLARFERAADRVICPLRPERFSAIGEFYADFSQVSTETARRWLDDARALAS